VNGANPKLPLGLVQHGVQCEIGCPLMFMDKVMANIGNSIPQYFFGRLSHKECGNGHQWHNDENNLGRIRYGLFFLKYP